MPIYEWKGFDGKGKKASGVIDADSERDARNKCKKSGQFVTSINLTKGGKEVKKGKGKKEKKKSNFQKNLEAARGRGEGAIRGKTRTEEVANFT